MIGLPVTARTTLPPCSRVKRRWQARAVGRLGTVELTDTWFRDQPTQPLAEE